MMPPNLCNVEPQGNHFRKKDLTFGLDAFYATLFYPNDKEDWFCIVHAWIFFKLCILITHYIRTMKMYLSNKIVKYKA